MLSSLPRDGDKFLDRIAAQGVLLVDLGVALVDSREECVQVEDAQPVQAYVPQMGLEVDAYVPS
jgi:hypothetical protein